MLEARDLLLQGGIVGGKAFRAPDKFGHFDIWQVVPEIIPVGPATCYGANHQGSDTNDHR